MSATRPVQGGQGISTSSRRSTGSTNLGPAILFSRKASLSIFVDLKRSSVQYAGIQA
jgi:hypothetical protein